MNIQVNNIAKDSLYSTPKTQEFRKLIKEKSRVEVYEYLKNQLDEDTVYYLNILNKYYFLDKLDSVIDYIDDDLKNIYLKNDSLNGINVIDLNSYLISDKDYVFVLGFNNENVPKTYKDIDYFNDDLKHELGLLTSIDKNQQERLKIINNINNIKNIFISYKTNTPYNSYYPSTLITELNLNIEEIKIDNNSSILYNKIKLTNSLDNLLIYNVKDNDLSKLYHTYSDIKYLSYNNKFTRLNSFKLDKLTLSYTSMNNYYHCKFRYYIENILKLNIYEESFKQFVGTMFHDILSHIYDKDFDFNYQWDKNLEEHVFSHKEKFFLKDLKEELLNIIKVINYQYTLTGLTNLKLEQEITVNYGNNKFIGIVDKIMFKEKEGNTYISIIDYKTGHPKINIDNLKYGLDMQLPVYVYLVLNSNLFKNPQIIGFYLEQILHEKSNFTDDIEKQLIDNLKLQGYSINDSYLLSMFDSTYENSQMIKGMKTTKNGFYAYSKVLSNEDILNISKIVEEKIKQAFNEILAGDFTINPKVINGANEGCMYCKYQDICFKTGNDLIYINE